MSELEENSKHFQERRLGRTVLRTYRTYVDLYDLVPNERQPREGEKEDPELQRQIEANEGIFEPLLVEPHPDLPEKYRIIDGDRRWTNSIVLVEEDKKEQYRNIPVEITDRTLNEDERFRVWIYIHRQRKEWDTKEKEMVAYKLVEHVGRASAANILGITIRELDKLVDIYELADKKLKNILPDPAAAVTWAREIKNINKNLLTPEILKVIVDRISKREITNSKEIRKLRKVLNDPIAKERFISGSSLDEALDILPPPSPKKKQGLVGDIEELADSLKQHSWTTIAELRGNKEFLQSLEETERLLKALKKQLSD